MSAEKVFEEGFQEIAGKVIPAKARKGLAAAAFALLRDAVREEPTVPLDEGTLRGSGSAFVGKELIQTTQNGGKGTPATENSVEGAERPDRELVAVVGFNTPYAARLHEHPEFDFQEPGSGGKYLETPMVQNRDKYMKLITGEIK